MKQRKGFTLVELVIVIAVIAILAAVLIPTFAGILERARENTRIQQVTSARNEILSGNENFTSISDLEGYVFTIEESVYQIIKGEVVNISSDVNIEDVKTSYSEASTQPLSSDIVIYLPKEEIITTEEIFINFRIDKTDNTATVIGYNGIPEGELIIPEYIQGEYETKLITTEYEEFNSIYTKIEDYFYLNPESEKEYIVYYNDGENDCVEYYNKKNYYNVLNLENYSNFVLEEEVTTYCTGENVYKVVAIEERSFMFNSTITSVIIPDTVETIGEYAFASSRVLTSVELGSGVKEILLGAFYDSGLLEEVNLPEGLEYLGEIAFSDCDSLTNIKIPTTLRIMQDEVFAGTNVVFNEDDSGYYLPTNNNPYFVLYKAKSSTTTVEINEQTEIIAGEAFYGSSITQITIPENVKTIGNGGFKKCESLTTVTMYPVEYVGEYGFSYSDAITSVYFNGTVKDWCNIAFYGTTSNPCWNDSNLYFNGESISKIVVPEGVESLYNTFFRVQNITEIVLPNTLKYISSHCFNGSTLTKINIPASVEYIGESAFRFCADIEEITFEHGEDDVLELTSLAHNVNTTYVTIYANLENGTPINPTLKNYSWSGSNWSVTYVQLED